MSRIKYFNTETQAWEKADIAGKESKTTNIVHNFYEAEAKGKYDLKDGYATTADIYIAADGTETTKAGLSFECTDYIPVEAGVSYTTAGTGYALYDKNKTFISAEVDIRNYGAVREFTPSVDGYARISFRGGATYARFCKTEDKMKSFADYMPKASPFSGPAVPCDVELWGDSNSYGYGLSDTANSWANRLGSLITNMPTAVYNDPDKMSCFCETYSVSPKLRDWGVLYFGAYTNSFIVNAQTIGSMDVYIDGVAQTQMTASPAEYTVDWGYHTIELRGVSGQNMVANIVTNKKRSFVNRAVSGTNSHNLGDPVGNVQIVMYGSNDRSRAYGDTSFYFSAFYRKCLAAGAELYIFSPIPTKSGGEEHDSYVKTINEVINEIPDVNYIDVYKDMQLFSLLSTESLYKDDLHLNDYGHKVLFAIAASGLHLAVLNSVFDS